MKLLIAPTAGFYFSWEGCLGVVGENHGLVEVRDGLVTLACELPNVPGEYGATFTEFAYILLADRSFLIPKEKLHGFANDFLNHAVPEAHMHSRYALMKRHENVSIAALDPGLLEAFYSALLKPMIQGEVCEVLDAEEPADDSSTEEELHVRLSLGAVDGVYRNMVVRVVGSTAGEFSLGVVRSVDKTGATVVILPRLGVGTAKVGDAFTRHSGY